jgi:hypothetical protein
LGKAFDAVLVLGTPRSRSAPHLNPERPAEGHVKRTGGVCKIGGCVQEFQTVHRAACLSALVHRSPRTKPTRFTSTAATADARQGEQRSNRRSVKSGHRTRSSEPAPAGKMGKTPGRGGDGKARALRLTEAQGAGLEVI